MQSSSGLASVISESCLFLNIWMPTNQKKPASGWPVMIFIHGGAFLSGSGGNPLDVQNGIDQNLYNGTSYASQGVMFVTLNYRLGAFGFYGGALSSGNINYNLGLQDQQVAMQFIKNYASVFGGNPNAITIFGESSGAMSVGLHLFSVPSNVTNSTLPWQGAVMESNPFAANYPQVNTASFVRANNVNTAFLDTLCNEVPSTDCTAGPMVTFTGGGGSGAVAVAVVGGTSTGQAAGTITALKVLNPGSGYGSTAETAPTATITGGGGTGAKVSSVTVDPVTGGVLLLTLGNAGSGYSAPTATVNYLQSSVNASQILQAQNTAIAAGFIATDAFNLPWTPVVDGKFVTTEPYAGFPSTTVPIPIGFGVNQNEGAVFAGAAYQALGPTALGIVYPTELSTLSLSSAPNYARYSATADNQGPVPPYFSPTSSALSNLITDFGMWCGSAFAMDNVTNQIATYNTNNPNSPTNAKVYGYLFSQTPFTDVYNLQGTDSDGGACEPNLPNGLVSNVCHAGELPYVFNTLNSWTVTPVGGSGATATATVANGQVTALTPVAVGSGYAANPTVSFPANKAGTAAGTATVANGAVTMITVTQAGKEYLGLDPSVTVSGGTGSGATGTYYLDQDPGGVAGVDVRQGGSGYQAAPNVVISGGGGSGATATPNVSQTGTITSYTVTSGGSGYTSTPTVQIQPAGYNPTSDDKTIACQMNGAWAAFAQNPQSPGSLWTTYTTAATNSTSPGATVGVWSNGTYTAKGATLNPVIQPAPGNNAKVSATNMCSGFWYNQPPLNTPATSSLRKKK